ncbi:MAG: methyltransferase domain-containing protein [Candidatus Nanohaloarchaea archaeon]
MESNDELVDYLVKKDHIKTDKVEKAFREVNRADFIDKNPYIDRPVALVEDSTISAPHIVAEMLELIEPEGRVLEMGSGSGYVLALLTQLCDDVVGVERIEELVNESRERGPEAEIIFGYQVPDQQFDKILYSFAAPEEEVREAMDKTGAEIVVAPVQEEGRQVLKKYSSDGETSEGYVRFVTRKEGVRSE